MFDRAGDVSGDIGTVFNRARDVYEEVESCLGWAAGLSGDVDERIKPGLQRIWRGCSALGSIVVAIQSTLRVIESTSVRVVALRCPATARMRCSPTFYSRPDGCPMGLTGSACPVSLRL